MLKLRRSRFWQWTAIVLSIIAVGFGLFRLLTATPVNAPEPLVSPTLPSKTDTGVTVNLGGETGSDGLDTPGSRSTTLTPGATLIGPTSPADGWANALLDQIEPLFDAGLLPGDGFAWWQSQSERARLNYHDGQVLIDLVPLAPAVPPRLVVSIPDSADANMLRRVGLVETNGDSLTLTVFRSSSSLADKSWIVTNIDTVTPLKALVIQAAARSLDCIVAFDNGDASVSELVVLNLEHRAETDASTPTPTLTKTPPAVQPSVSPTATRAPDISLGRLIAARLDTVIDGLAAIPQSDIAAYVNQHSAPGPLTWTETGPQFSGRPMGISQAIELKVEYLSPASPTNAAVTFFTADYENDVTHLLEDHVGFQGHRMEEIVYWMVYHSAQRQGTLIVSYDDFGARQSIGIVGFAPFPQSP